MEANVQNASASSRYGGYPREKTIYDPENIPRAPRQVWIHLDDNQKQSTSMYRDRLYEEITKRGFNRKPGLDAAPTGAAG